MSQVAPPPSMARPPGRGGAGRASEPPRYYRCRPGRNRGTLRGAVGNAVVACDDPRRFPRMRVVLNCGEHAPQFDDGADLGGAGFGHGKHPLDAGTLSAGGKRRRGQCSMLPVQHGAHRRKQDDQAAARPQQRVPRPNVG